MALEHRFADLQRVAPRWQVGAGEEDLAAAGGDRHEAIEHHQVADRPRSDNDRHPRQQHRRSRQGAGGALAAKRGGEEEQCQQRGDRQVLGSHHRGRPQHQTGPEPAGRPGSIGGPHHRQHRSREEGRAQRLGHQHPPVLEQGRVDGDRRRGDQPRGGTRQPAPDQVGEEHRERGHECQHHPREPRVDPAGDTVEPADEQGQARRVVAGGLHLAGREVASLGERSVLLDASSDSLIRTRVENLGPVPIPGVADSQSGAGQEDHQERG